MSEKKDDSQEKRRYYRKGVNLPGEYAQVPTENVRKMLVIDISFQGLRFETFEPHGLKEGDILQVRFKLDDRRRTLIKRKVQVKSIQEKIIGAQFVKLPDYDKDLGFYLMR